jgi:DNA gyrase subunit A
MARRSSTPAPDEDFEERIIDIDVADELSDSYREYAYSVIYSRAIPDARDGLKPVHRRILYQMNEMGLRPDRGFVKCARVVGDVMGKLHPHSDTAIYDSLVRMAQPWAMRLPLVAGHGNFGSLGGDDPPAAMRYTEARLSPAAMIMTGGIDEDTVAFGPNYDGQELEPEVLPSAFPNLLVNGSAGIAVGMATNMPPHNLAEVVAAARHLIKHPTADLDTLMGFVPGPDLPTGGRIIGEAGIRDAYETGRGVFKMRATAVIEKVTARREGIVVTELPFNVGPERVIAKVKELVQAKRIQGITDLKDLSDRFHGLQLVIEIKAGFNPEAILEQLYKLTPMEESFGINNVALVDGQPLTLGLKELLEVYLDHRFDVVRRRTTFRRTKRLDRLHLVEGLLVALVDIDRVIRTIRESDDAAAAKDNLMTAFALSDKQATYILDTPLRRLTKFDKLELETERDKLVKEIKELTAILDSDTLLRKVVSDELAAVAKEFGTPRRSVLVEGAMPTLATVALEISDDPVRVLLSATGLLARTPSGELTLGSGGARSRSDAIPSVVSTTIRGEVGAVTTLGRLIRFPVIDLPVVAPSKHAPSLSGGAPVSEFVPLEEGERVLCLCSLNPESAGLAIGTVQGVVKRVTPDYPRNRDVFEVITLKEGDTVSGAIELTTGEEDLVFITTDAQLLRYSASLVRPQGCPAGGMAGISLAEDQSVIFFGAVDPGRDALVVSMAGSDGVLDGVDAATTMKATPYALYPAKGRATGGVRCQRFLRGEHRLIAAWAVNAPAYASAENGAPLALPPVDPRRDGSGTPVEAPIAYLTGPAQAG